MRIINIVLPESAHAILNKHARKKGVDLAQYCSALLTESVDSESSQPPLSEKPPGLSQDEQVTEVDLMREILAFLKRREGATPKTTVERAIFEKFKPVFQSPHYSELVGGGVPRWKKNVQFARNTARNMGLIKPPGESGRGNWELTEKGRQWNFE